MQSDAQQLARIRASICPESVVWDAERRRRLTRDEIAYSVVRQLPQPGKAKC